MNVLSLFDGISAGRVALQRAGIKVDNYFASEIDKYATRITQKNFPDTIQLGDVNNWKNWNLPKIDLLIGGSPCQGFSMSGKHLNFDDPRSKLFFNFIGTRNIFRPNWFILENVKMKKEWQDIISFNMGMEPIEIDSALVSGQSRKRLYWTNIQWVIQPENKGILLRDILEEGAVDREKSYCIDANYYKGGSPAYLKRNYDAYAKRQIVLKQSERRLMVKQQVGSLYENNGQAGRIYSIDAKSVTINANGGGMGGKTGLYLNDSSVRKLTPLECERLQTFSDGYTEFGIHEKTGKIVKMSNTQRYKTLGNSFTIDVIVHILSFIGKGINWVTPEQKEIFYNSIERI